MVNDETAHVHIAELEDIRARADALRAKTRDIAERLHPIDVPAPTRTMSNTQQREVRVIE